MARTWLSNWDLLDNPDGKEFPPDWALHRFWALSKCHFRDIVGVAMRYVFLCCLHPCENKLAAIQTDIGQVWDPKYHYHLDLTNTVPIWVELLCFHPEEEVWLDVHLDKLVAKGVIGPILLEEQLQCSTLLLLVPGIQPGQPYQVCQNIVPVNKRMAECHYQLNEMRR